MSTIEIVIMSVGTFLVICGAAYVTYLVRKKLNTELDKNGTVKPDLEI